MAYYAIQFQKELLDNSSSKIFSDACLEWEITGHRILDSDEDSEHCICSHEIRQLITIQNKINGYNLTIGCDCAERIPNLPNVQIYAKALINLKDLKNKQTKRLNGPALQVLRLNNILPEKQISFLENMKCKKKITAKQDKYYCDLVEKILKICPNRIDLNQDCGNAGNHVPS